MVRALLLCIYLLFSESLLFLEWICLHFPSNCCGSIQGLDFLKVVGRNNNMTTCAEPIFQQSGGVSRDLFLLYGLLNVPT